MKKRSFLILTLTSIWFHLYAQDQALPTQEKPLKIGYTNIEYILGFLPEARGVESECKSFEKQLENQLEAKVGEFQQKVQAFQQGYETMTEAVRNQKQIDLQRSQGNIEQLQLEAQEKLAHKRTSLIQPIYARVQKAIRQVAEENGYTHVFNADIGAMPILLYAGEEYNISHLVLTKLEVNTANPKGKKK